MSAAGRWDLRRVRPPGVRPLEVWNLAGPEGQLWEMVGVSRVEAMRQRGHSEPEIASALVASLVPAVLDLHECLRFDALFLGGGLLAVPGLKPCLEDTAFPFPVDFASDPMWVGEAGGFALLREAGRPDGAVADVGQTAIKASTRGGRLVRERDCQTLPFRFINARGHSQGCPTKVAAAFLAGALADLLAESPPADPAIVLALPCPLDDECVPGPCTYGWEGDRELLPRVFAMLDERLRVWPGVRSQVLVLNDAELAAVAARVSEPQRGLTLCLTLGFGPGGALIEG